MTAIKENEHDRPQMTRAKTRVFRLAALLLGMLIGFAVTEVCLRIVGYSSPEFYAADSALGYRLIPGVSGWYAREGRNFVSINSAGFHDAERTVEKPSGTFRLAVIGDSYVEALQVPRSEAFTTILNDSLAGCSEREGRSIEVLSFGVSGYGTGQELVLLREKVLAYRPDAVLLMLTTNNDITDNIREMKGSPIPYFVLEDGQLVLDDSFRSDRSYATRSSMLGRLGVELENNLRFVQAMRAVIRTFKVWTRENKPAAVETAAGKPLIEAGIDVQVYREPTDETWKRAWAVTEAIITAMKRDVEASNARLVVATGSNGVQVLPEVRTREAFSEMLGVADLYYPDRRVADLGRSNGFSVITLAPVLADYAAREKVNLHGFEGNIGYGHWNATGHRIAGEELGKRLCTDLFRR